MTPNSTDSATRDGLHIEIMQLPCDTEECPVGGFNAMLAYKSGHRDARHAAADLALEFDALLAASRAEVEGLRAASAQHKRMADILFSSMQLVRQYPDFDGRDGEENLLGDVMDAAMRGEVHSAVKFIAEIHANYEFQHIPGPSPQEAM